MDTCTPVTRPDSRRRPERRARAGARVGGGAVSVFDWIDCDWAYRTAYARVCAAWPWAPGPGARRHSGEASPHAGRGARVCGCARRGVGRRPRPRLRFVLEIGSFFVCPRSRRVAVGPSWPGPCGPGMRAPVAIRSYGVEISRVGIGFDAQS